MRYNTLTFLSITFALLLLAFSAHAQERHAESVISEIMQTKQALMAKDGHASQKYIFLAFWDFDGTILKGDCSEGLKQKDGWLYKGLAQLAIEHGYSNIYAPKGGADRFWHDYRHMEDSIGKWLAYPFIPQMLRGARLIDIQALAEKHFEREMSQYYFNSSMQILKALEDAEIKSYVISASADVFVDAAAKTVGLDIDRLHGIQLLIEHGQLTEKLVYPVTWSDGKTEKLKAIVAEMQKLHPSKEVVVIAAFGNSYSTDGPFMKYVAKQVLPAGKPLAVMINGGEAPATYHDLFWQVNQFETVNKH